jgi:DNA-binding transcriptional LysR family regulator
MAQPAVSIAVRKLEESLGVTLLDRQGRRALLTVEGRSLLPRAQRILREAEEMKQAGAELRGLLEGELVIACPSMVASYFLPQLLSGFLEQHPGLKASVIQVGTRRVHEMILDNEVEIGVVPAWEGDSSDDIEVLPLLSQQILLCANAGHPLAQQRSVSVEALDALPMAVYESGYFIRSQLDNLCAQAGVQPEYRVQSNFLPLLLYMVRQGIGCTVGLEVLAEQERDIVGIPFEPPIGINVALARRRGRVISRAHEAFLEWVRAKT